MTLATDGATAAAVEQDTMTSSGARLPCCCGGGQCWRSCDGTDIGLTLCCGGDAVGRATMADVYTGCGNADAEQGQAVASPRWVEPGWHHRGGSATVAGDAVEAVAPWQCDRSGYGNDAEGRDAVLDGSGHATASRQSTSMVLLCCCNV